MAELFLSYARADGSFAQKLSAQLEAAGASVWMDVEDIEGGATWWVRITRAINQCTRCILVMSPRSMASPQVRREVLMAFEKGRPILPVRLEDCEVHEELEYALSGVQWVDFVENSFEEATTAVRQALGATAAPRTLRTATLSDDELDLRTIGRGPAYPLRVASRGGVALATEGEAIDGALRMIVFTAPGERVGRPDFGCTLADLLFERPDDRTLREVGERVRAAIDRWEPRAQDVEVGVRLAPGSSPYDRELEILLTYTVRGTGERRDVAFRHQLL